MRHNRERIKAQQARRAAATINNKKPCQLSVRTVGAKRWAWFATKDGAGFYSRFGDEPTNEQLDMAGYADSQENAISAAKAFLGTDDYGLLSGGWAFAWHKRQVESRQAQRKPNTKETGQQVTEYLFSHYHDPDNDWGYWWTHDPEKCRAWGMNPYTSISSCAHRIIKKTARFIFVERDKFGSYDWQTGEIKAYTGRPLHDETCRIDRADFERTGCASTKHCIFYALPYEKTEYYQRAVEHYNRRQSNTSASTPPCITALGLSLPCTVEDVKSAWRQLVKESHPDVGGDASRFIELKDHYNSAIKFFGENK